MQGKQSFKWFETIWSTFIISTFRLSPISCVLIQNLCCAQRRVVVSKYSVREPCNIQLSIRQMPSTACRQITRWRIRRRAAPSIDKDRCRLRNLHSIWASRPALSLRLWALCRVETMGKQILISQQLREHHGRRPAIWARWTVWNWSKHSSKRSG